MHIFHKKTNEYRPEIDGLRAFAVIAVIINHFNKDILPSGYLGVDIFFVISGFVITSSLDRRRRINIFDFVSSFYERRLKRLMPGLLAFVVVTSFVICILDPDPVSSLKTGIYSIFGFSNLILFRDSVDYFAQSSEFNPFTHTWSLAVEEQFYLVFPFLVWYTGFGDNTNQSSRKLFLLLFLASLISLTCYLVIYPIRISAAYFLMPTRFWEIASGSLLYLSPKNNFKLLKFTEQIPSLITFLVISIILFLPQNLGMFLTIFTVILSCILIHNIKSNDLIYKLFTNKFSIYIGLASYSLYLWHWPIITFGKWLNFNNDNFYFFQLVLLILISIISYEFIEKPFRFNYKSSLNRLKIFIIVSITGFIAALFNRFLSFNYQNKFFVLTRNLLVPVSNPIEDYGVIHDKIIRFCHDPPDGDIKNIISRCLEIKNRDNKKAIFIIGDSHATNHYPSIRSANKILQNKFHIKFLAENGMITSIYSRDNCLGVIRCLSNSWYKHKEFFEKELKKDDIVIFSWVRYRVAKLRTSNLPRIINKKRVDRLESKLVELNRIINNKKAKLLLVDDLPMTCKNPEINYSYFILKAGEYELCKINKEISRVDREGITQTFKKISGQYQNVFYIDFHDKLCGEIYCTIFDPRNGKLLYGDNRGHFTTNYPDPLTEEWKGVLFKF